MTEDDSEQFFSEGPVISESPYMRSLDVTCYTTVSAKAESFSEFALKTHVWVAGNFHHF